MKQHKWQQAVRPDDAVLNAVKHGRHRRRIFGRIQFALLEDRIAHQLVIFHTNRFDPSHVLFPFVVSKPSAHRPAPVEDFVDLALSAVFALAGLAERSGPRLMLRCS